MNEYEILFNFIEEKLADRQNKLVKRADQTDYCICPEIDEKLWAEQAKINVLKEQFEALKAKLTEIADHEISDRNPKITNEVTPN